MRAALDKVPRDIMFSFCQYGAGNVWEWGAEIGGNSWRTTGDIQDNWQQLVQHRLPPGRPREISPARAISMIPT